uniref:Uncharacterized protein n=1 Tax=Leersia perrieri TaxID=77586 RepID=A0A0D9UZ47_9ORYZ
MAGVGAGTVAGDGPTYEQIWAVVEEVAADKLKGHEQWSMSSRHMSARGKFSLKIHGALRMKRFCWLYSGRSRLHMVPDPVFTTKICSVLMYIIMMATDILKFLYIGNDPRIL